MDKALQLHHRRAPPAAAAAAVAHLQHQMPLLLPTFGAAGRGQQLTKEGRVANCRAGQALSADLGNGHMLPKCYQILSVSNVDLIRLPSSQIHRTLKAFEFSFG